MTKALLESLCILLCVPWTLQEVVQLPGCDASLPCLHGGPSYNSTTYFNNLMLLGLGSRAVSNASQFDVAALVSTVYAPSIIVFEVPTSTPANNRTAINWKSLLNGNLTSNVAIPGVGIDGSVFGITFARVWEFNSTQNADTLIHYDQCKSYDLSDPASFHWQQAIVNDKPDYTSLILRTTPDSVTNLTLLINAWPKSEGRDSDLPRLQHTPGSLQLQLVSNNTRTKASGAFAVELNVVAYMKDDSVPPERVFKYDKSTILDDEQSPGVFSSALVRLAGQSGADKKTADKHGFLIWKPVAYNDVVKNTESVLVARTYPLNAAAPRSVASIGKALVMSSGGGRFYTASFNVSFGESGANAAVGEQSYNTWTALIGVGDEKYDPISVGVIMAILFGLGVPIVMLILVGGYLIIWKRRNRRPPVVVGVDNPVISGPYGSDL